MYAGGLSRAQVAIASVVQRPITAAALGEATTVDPPAATPKWEIVALQDNAIPTKAEFFIGPAPSNTWPTPVTTYWRNAGQLI